MTEADLLVRDEVYQALMDLGAKSGLLSIVGSWGDTLDSETVLAMMKELNAEKKLK